MFRPFGRLVSLIILFSTTTVAHGSPAPLQNETEINGFHLHYVEDGTGEPVVFIHGALSDNRAWESIRDEVAKKYHFIALTQRYFGPSDWNDDGKEFGSATHADDLAQFISSLRVGPVHLVGWSYGGTVAAVAALRNPSLVRSLILYDPSLASVLPADSAEEKAAREDRARRFGPSIAASKAGDPVKSMRLLVEGLFGLTPGGFDDEPQAWRQMWRENARITPLLFAASPPVVTCDMLHQFTRPTLVMGGEKSPLSYALVNAAIVKCVPEAQRVVLRGVGHDGPVRDPAGFSAPVLEFLSKH